MADDLSIGQAVELCGVENAGLDITGARGTVADIPPSGLVCVKLDGSDTVISTWPENLKIVRESSTQVADRRSDYDRILSINQVVEITGMEGFEINGKRGTVTATPGSGLISVTIDGSGEVVGVKPENLNMIT